jgi:hypothetical protein
VQDHLGSHLNPESEYRNFRKTVITNSTNHYANLEDTCGDKITRFGVIVRYTTKVIEKKKAEDKFDPGWPFEG